MGELKAKEYKRFEDIKRLRADGGEYWLARELSVELDYVPTYIVKVFNVR